MSKYIDAEKLIAEIERLKERAQAERVLHPKTILSAKNYLLIKDYDALLSFITSLQQEQPIGEEYAIEIGRNTHTLRVGSQTDIDNLIRQEKQEQPQVADASKMERSAQTEKI